MPTYAYRREDGTKFKVRQRITEDPLEKCPETGQDVERIITGSAGLIFKGEGFYVNDYGNGSAASNGSGNGADSPTNDPESTESATATSSNADGDN